MVTRSDLVRALERSGSRPATVVDAMTAPVIVAYPDELLADAVDRMVSRGLGRLLVVDPQHPKRLLGYLGRTSIATAWRGALEEEQVREAGWVSSRARLLRRNLRRVLRSGDAGPTSE